MGSNPGYLLKSFLLNQKAICHLIKLVFRSILAYWNWSFLELLRFYFLVFLAWWFSKTKRENNFHIFRTLKNSLNGSSFIWSRQTSHKSALSNATSVRRKTPPKSKNFLKFGLFYIIFKKPFLVVLTFTK